jgi:integrase
MSKRQITRHENSSLAAHDELTFNFLLTLPGRASSRHSQRAYYRWIDQYLVDVAGWKPTEADARLQRMSALPVTTLRNVLSAPQLRAWLGKLAQGGHGKQGITQARAAVVTLASLLSEAGWLEDSVSAGISNVRPPSAEAGQRPGRWLSADQVRLLMASARQIATTDNQVLRNTVVMTMLCTMALRREELVAARWGDLSLQNERPILRVHGKGRKVATVDVPRSVLWSLNQWRGAVRRDDPRALDETAVIRRVWKGGRVSKQGLTVDGLWKMVDEASTHAGIGHVAPHDLRRSVAGALQQSGVPIEKISRLLRHSNLAVTERYLSKLPQRNEGAILMSSMLGFEEDELT